MPIREEYNLAYAKYTKLLEEHNAALIQAISVSDEVSKEIFHEAYMEVRDKLQLAEVNYKSLEPRFIKEIADEIFVEYMEFYSKQFVECSIEHSFAIQGYNLTELTSHYRMRPIHSLQQKRELCMLANELKIQIQLIDYVGATIETIGKFVSDSPDKKIIIRCVGVAAVPESVKYIPVLHKL